MAKIENVNRSAPSPVEQMKTDALRVERERDTRNRVIGVKKLTFLDTFRIAKALGDHSANATAFNQALMVASVVEIDGEPVRFPSTDAQIEALMLRLDLDGVSAAAKALQRFAPQDEDAEKAAIKN